MTAHERSFLLPAPSGSPSLNASRYTGTRNAAAAASEHQLSLRAGGVVSSVVNMCTATLGAGCLALPWAMSQCGLALGIFMLCAAALASIFTIRLLVRLYNLQDRTSFESLALRAFGPVGAALTHLTLLIFCFGTAVASIMVVGDMLQPMMQILLPQVRFLHHKPTLQFFLTSGIMLPLSFYTHISSMRIMSMLSTAGVLVLACVFGWDGLSAIAHDRVQPIRWVRTDSTILLALPIIMFAYTCQTNIFSILAEQTDQRRCTDFKVVNISVGIETLIYCIIATAGYIVFGDEVDGNVLNSAGVDKPAHVLAQVAIGLSLCLSFPLCIYPARFTIHELLWPGEPEHGDDARSRFRSVSLTLLLVFGALLSAVYIPSISELFALLGSTTSALIAFILPTSMYLALGPNHAKQAFRRLLCLILLTASILVAVLTTFRSLQFAIVFDPRAEHEKTHEAAHMHQAATGAAHVTGPR